MFELDGLDRKLISELQKDAYRTHTELARCLGTSKTTVTRRMQRLLNNGVFRIVGVINPQKVGLGTSALIGLDVSLHNVDAVIEQLAARPEVNLITVVTGRYDIVISVTVNSAAELARFLRKEIASIDGVTESETLLALETMKQTHYLTI